MEGYYELAILDLNKALEINPKYARAYYLRAAAYVCKGKYDQAWKDVYKAQNLGYEVDLEFLKKLRKASGRKR